MSYCQGYTTPELVALWDSLRYHCDLDIAYTMGSIVYWQRKSEDPSSDPLEFKLPMPHARTMPHRWRAVRWVADSLYNPPTGLDGGHLCPHRPLTLRLRSGEQFDLLVPKCECFEIYDVSGRCPTRFKSRTLRRRPPHQGVFIVRALRENEIVTLKLISLVR